jgi:hypothetical protein
MAIYKPSLLDKFKDFVNGLKSNWDEYEDHVAEFDAHLADYEDHVAEFDAHLEDTATQTKLGHLKLPENWIRPTLQNGWSNLGGGYADIGYYKDEFGVVHIHGFLTGGVETSGTTIFVLPVGYRPNKNMYYGCVSMSDTNEYFAGYIRVESNGNVKTSGNIKNKYLPISICFRV